MHKALLRYGAFPFITKCNKMQNAIKSIYAFALNLLHRGKPIPINDSNQYELRLFSSFLASFLTANNCKLLTTHNRGTSIKI